MLGSRNSRRQLQAVLAAAAEAGAYSVGFCVARGGLSGFSVYFAGDYAGACRGTNGAAAYTCAVPPSSRVAPTTACAQPTARTPAAAAAPAPPAAARKRGCRAGAKQQLRRHGGRGRSTATVAAVEPAATLEGVAVHASRPWGKDMNAPAAPPAPPPYNNNLLIFCPILVSSLRARSDFCTFCSSPLQIF